MNNKSILLRGLLYSLVLVLVGSLAQASPIALKSSVNAIQAEHARKIAEGYRTGALTEQERTSLINQQNRIKIIEARFRQNGLQANERRQLLTLLRWAERTIQAKLTNKERVTLNNPSLH
ncbi:hypothetical protein [uncultured Thiothrix sp.]|jgi:hypothetical protein|uniref:hypothetical protein n=1 Tax=uncultured Thiothrix sp. TaxID=223185 RepID=UPI002625611A|nr:hypothetical protein [uncultured Thiothrix sp.]HMT92948.1 hypothetical protein [Thiolinea sp.]